MSRIDWSKAPEGTTHANVAAEERQKAIDELCIAAEERIDEGVAALIIDAGYRKVGDQ